MSWGFSAIGMKRGVLKKAKEAQFNEHQVEKDFIIAQIEKIGDNEVVKVSGNGHSHGAQNTLNLSVETMQSFVRDEVPDPPVIE